MCYVNCEICYLVHLELKIGLVNDIDYIVCELIYLNMMPVMDMLICEPSSGLGRSQLGAVSLNLIGRTNETVLL